MYLRMFIDTDWKLGLIGRNGKGKTTFLKLLLDKYKYQGTITKSIEFDYFPFEIKNKERMTLEIIHEIIPNIEDWKIIKELNLLNTDAEILYKEFKLLSGGEQVKVLLVSLFLKENNFLLIDEPTNHLDTDTRNQLVEYLKKKKSFYYQSKYFTAVSGMIYRMKQNAVGLANICILSTMVLVMISTTICMYMGMDDILTTRFPREFEVTSFYPNSETKENVRGIIEEEAKRGGVSVKDRMEYHCGGIAVLKEGNEFKIAEDEDVYSGNEDILELKMIPLEDYNALEGRNVSLGDDEVLIYNPDSKAEKMGGTLRIEGVSYKIQEELETFLLEEKNESRVIGCKYIIVKDEEKIQELLNLAYERLKDENPQLDEIKVEYKVCFDLEGADKDVRKTETVIKNRVKEEVGSSYCDGREIERESFYLLYGGLFFIGLYLGFMFLIATVLIIYYKQISEGHDDRERYQIMQKVGMSKKEVRQSIRSQVLMVFFLPLAAAVLHIAVAFKVITKLLVALNMVNVSLFLTCTVATVVVFAVFYAAVFGVTAREYYRIVG